MALKRSIFWVGLAQATTLVLQFAGSVVLARFITPYEMGIYAVGGATVALLALIQAFGLQSLIVREEVMTPAISRTSFTINAVTAVLLSLATVAFASLGGSLLGDERVRQVMLALAINPLFGIFDFLPAAHLEREGRFKVMSIAGITSGAVAAGVTIVAAVAGARYMTAAYAGWASAGTYAIFVNVAGRRHASFRPGISEWRRATAFGLQMLATSGLHAIGGRVSDICLGKFQGLDALGIYGRAGNLNGLIWNNIHLAAGRVMFVDFADLHRRRVDLRDRYIATVDIITALLWPAFAGAAVLAGPFIHLVYGDRWVAAALPMALLSVSSIVLVSITMTWEIFTATGNIATQTRIEFYNAIFSTVAFAVGSAIGLAAAAASRIVASVVSVVIYRPHLSRMTGTVAADFTGIYLRSALLTVLAIGPATALMLRHRFSPSVPLPLVAGSILLGVLLWFAGIVILRHRLLEEGRTLLLRRRRSRLAPQAIAAGLSPYAAADGRADG